MGEKIPAPGYIHFPTGEKAGTSLKYFNEDMKELALCCAGSHIGVSMNRESFPVGQVDFLNLFPMNFEEFLMAVNKRKAAYLSSTSSAPDSTYFRISLKNRPPGPPEKLLSN